MFLRVFIITITFAATALPSACNSPEPDKTSKKVPTEATTTVPHVVEIIGLDYAFSAPVEISSGWTTFRFTNRGKEPHHMVVVRLEDGHTVADLKGQLENFKPLPEWTTALGGPNVPNPGGGVSNATLYLEPGNYALMCMIPSPKDQKQHFMKGMIWPLTVTKETTDSSAPKADIEITLSDYAFELSKPITSGEHTIHVTNNATTQPHEVELVRLMPGKSVEEVVRWVHNPQGPPPAQFIGGVTDLSPGESAFFTAQFEPGEYAWICFVPDYKDRRPHFMHGMMEQFTVEAM